MTTGHFITHGQFAFGGNIDFDHLDYAGGQVITLFHSADNTLITLTNLLGLSAVVDKDLLQLMLVLGALGKIQATQPLECNLIYDLSRQFFTELEQNVTLFILNIRLGRTTDQQIGQGLANAFFQAAEFIVHVTIEATDLVILDHQAALVLVHTFAGKDLGVNDHAFNARRYAQRRIFDIAGLFTEDCPQQFLFRRKHGFALGRYLAHQHVTGTNLSTDTNNAGVIQVTQGFITDIRNVAGDLFLTQLGIPGHSLENLDMDRGKGIFLEQPFIDKNGILKVVAAPGHEGDGHVLAQGQFTYLDRGSVCQHISFLYPFSGQNQRLLIKAGVLVGLFIFRQPVHTDTGIKTICSGLVIANNYPIGINLFHNSCTTSQQAGTRILGHILFNSGTHKGRSGFEQRNGLTLHIGTHESPVGVIVIQKRNQRGCHGNQLVRGDVHSRHLIGRDCDDLTIKTCDKAVINNIFLFFQVDFGRSHNMPLLLQGCKIPDLVSDLTILDNTVRGFNKPVGIHFGIGCQRDNKTDIRSLRGLNRTDTTVMGRMNITNLKAGPFTG